MAAMIRAVGEETSRNALNFGFGPSVATPDGVSYGILGTEVAMPFTLGQKHVHVGSHHRFWLIVVAIAAFIIAAFWAQPIG